MKAFVHLAVYCPECNSVMWREIDSRGPHLECIFSQCKNFHVQFKAPAIELEPFTVDDQQVQSLENSP
jgi:hypothetical protein